jgi:hypothetical protein
MNRKERTMSIVRRTMMTTAVAMGVLGAAGIGSVGEATSLLAPQLTIPAAGSIHGAGVFATPNGPGAELTPLSATPRVPWSAAAPPVSGSTETVGTAVLAERPNSLAPNG